MKKLGNLGFMLVEVIIVTVVVVSIMTSLYVVFNRVYKVYELKNKYANIDGIYALKLVSDDIVDNVKINNLLNDTNSYRVIDNSYCKNMKYCSALYDGYKINKIYLVNMDYVKNDSNDLYTSIKNDDTDVSETLKDYIDYFKKIYNYNSRYAYIIEITVDSNNKIYNYAYLPVIPE